MASIEHSLPEYIKASQDAEFGAVRPGVVTTRLASGPLLSRVWSDRSLRSYRFKVEMIPQDTSGLLEWKSFLRNTAHGTQAFWLKEPVDGMLFDAPCGPLGDASRTCFPMPIYGTAAAAPIVMADGSILNAGAYAVHDTANRVPDDNSCHPTATTGWGIIYGSLNLKAFSRFGAYSLEVSPGGAFGVEVYTAYNDRADVTPGETITALADVFDLKSGGRNFKFEMNYYDGGGSPLSTSLGSVVASDEGEWTVLSDSFVVPASAATAYANLIDQTTDTSYFYIDGWAIAPASYDRIHLPSMAPNVLEFGTAPALNERISVSVSGTPMARCKLDEDEFSWEMISPGHATPDRMRLYEDPEV